MLVRTPRLLLGPTLLLMLGPTVARGQTSGDDEAQRLATAQAAVLEGRDHLKAGRLAEAIAAYERAYLAFPDERHLFTIASARERVAGQCATALFDWDRFLSACLACADREAGVVRRTQLAQSCPAQLVVTSEPSGAAVRIGDRSLGTTPLTVEWAPGAVLVAAQLGEQPEQRQNASLEPGRAASLAFRFEQAAKVAAVPLAASVEPVDTGVPPLAVAGYVVAGVGLLGAGGLAVAMNASVDDFEGAETRSEARAAKSSAEGLAIGAQVAGGVGLAALGVALWLTIDRPTAAPGSTGAGITLSSGGPAALGLSGRF